MPSMNMFSKTLVTNTKDPVTNEQPLEKVEEKQISEESEEDFNSRSEDELELSISSEDSSGGEKSFAFSISDEEENGNFMFKTSLDDVEERVRNEDTNVDTKREEPSNFRMQSGMMATLTEQLAQRDKRLESGTTTPAVNSHYKQLPNASFNAAAIPGGFQGRIDPIPEMPSTVDFHPSVKARSDQSKCRKSFEVIGTFEASMKMAERSKDSSNMSSVMSTTNFVEEESTPEINYSEEKNDEDENEDNFDEDDDYGTVPKSRRIETMIDHRVRNRMLGRPLSMGFVANEFFAPELYRDYVRSVPRHRAVFSIDIQPTIWEGTKSDEEEIDSEHDSADDEKFNEALRERIEENTVSESQPMNTDENATKQIFWYLRTVLKNSANETAMENLKRLEQVFEQNRLRKEAIIKERDHLIASHIDFVATVAEAMSKMKANSGTWVTLS